MNKALNLDNILPNILIFLMNIKYAIRYIKKKIIIIYLKGNQKHYNIRIDARIFKFIRYECRDPLLKGLQKYNSINKYDGKNQLLIYNPKIC